MTAGYSGTPLIHKLGIKPGMKVCLVDEPDDYFVMLENDISEQRCKPGEKAQLVHLFARSKKDFLAGMKKVKKMMLPNTVVWVSWYKKSSGIATDVTEDVIRDYALQNDLVDVKVCAVSDSWSGLKLVVPLRKRH